jgi:hypothetical protein
MNLNKVSLPVFAHSLTFVIDNVPLWLHVVRLNPFLPQSI